MAYKISDLTGTVVSPSGTYPFGDVKDAPSGTVVDKKMVTDMLQFFQKMASEASVTLNSSPDNVTNGYQLMQSVTSAINSYAATWVLNSLGANYDSGKVYVIIGCETATSNGYVFYNGNVYYCAGRSGPVCGGGLVDTIQRTSPIDYTNGVQTVNILCAASGSGLSNFSDVVYMNEWQDMGLTSSDFAWGAGGSGAVDPSDIISAKYLITGNTVKVAIYISGFTITGTPSFMRVYMNFLPTALISPSSGARMDGVYYEGGIVKEPMFVEIGSSPNNLKCTPYVGFTAASDDRGISIHTEFEIASI